jgi:hypothetical protein
MSYNQIQTHKITTTNRNNTRFMDDACQFDTMSLTIMAFCLDGDLRSDRVEV